MATATHFPPVGQVHQLLGSAIATAYGAGTVSAVMNVGRANIVRFYVAITLAVGSTVTSITVKLKHRYNAGGTSGGYIDLPSKLYDVQGAAQPKGSTFEIEHAFTPIAANNSYDRGFFLDVPAGLLDLVIDVKADAAGAVGDSVTIYASAA
jgi:hypothetical protein